MPSSAKTRDGQRPDTAAILAQLKDFQRDTVEYMFRRMYLDDDCVRRFLLADEVGLGKTLVARGLIARAIDFLWDRSDRIDIVYVCSNTDIARQNINRLNVTGHDDFTLSSRITLLPIDVGDMQHRRINFVSFTPGTSFDLKNSTGRTDERELLYWLLQEPWSLSFKKATRVLQGSAGIDWFRYRVQRFPEWYDIHAGIHERFVEQLGQQSQFRSQFEAICEAMPRAGAKVPQDLNRERNGLIGELRRLLAQTCLHWLEPDLIILDEFQRFKHLLQGGNEDASPAAQLADHLFNYQQLQSDPATAARVLLLSATPYKMYTLSHETEQDDHYEDFRNTLDFLLPDAAERDRFQGQLRCYGEELFRLADHGPAALLPVKDGLAQSLRRVMVRTERLALTADRNGMLTEVPELLSLKGSDVQQYLALQQVARVLDHDDVLEYWKSAPYLLNFMEEYDLKRKLLAAVDSPEQDPALASAIHSLRSGLLEREEIERYARLDPANARLRAIHADTIERGVWRLLWIPPSLPYYQGCGSFADPELARFTKRLVFSCWRVVPKAIASALSYEAERCMVQTFRKKSRNTTEARKKRRPLLRFTFSKGRPTGMPVLGMLYPCRTLAERFDPLRLTASDRAPGQLPTLDAIVAKITEGVRELLSPVISRVSTPSDQPDERWYWAAPLLLDLQGEGDRLRHWFSQPDLAVVWSGDALTGDQEAARGWSRHVQLAREIVDGSAALGRPPEDLARTLADFAVAAPGVVTLRTLGRVIAEDCGQATVDLRSHAASLAHAFLHLFNLPEVMALLRDRHGEVPYWRSVLAYCAAGNLQAVLDEYAHVLIELLGLVGKKPPKVAAELCKEIQRCLTLRTATAQADCIVTTKRRVQIEEPLRLRTRFAMRFGDQDAEDSSEPTRADQVRAAFNSPFWPFVLATTSVGQEGLDFHPYCHAVVHWNVPTNPVDLEQREGRVHRYKGHALRRNVAARYGDAVGNGDGDPWAAMFDAACQSRPADQNDLFPFWITPDGIARIERHIPALPHSREIDQQANVRRSLVLYRMVFGQNRQEDLVDYLLKLLPEDSIKQIVDLCRVDLSPPRRPDQEST